MYKTKFAPIGALKMDVDEYIREHKYDDKSYGIKTDKKLIILAKGDAEDVPILNLPTLESDTVIVDLRMYTNGNTEERNIFNRINGKSAGSHKLKAGILVANDINPSLAKQDVIIKSLLLSNRISGMLSLDSYDINILTNALVIAIINDNFADLETGSKVAMYESLVRDNILTFAEAGEVFEDNDGLENIETILSELSASNRLGTIDFSFIEEASRGMTFSLLVQDIAVGLLDYRIFLPLVELSVTNVLYKKSWIGDVSNNNYIKKSVTEMLDVLNSVYATANIR